MVALVTAPFQGRSAFILLFALLYLLPSRSAATEPGALSVRADTKRWLGNDGRWSPIVIQVGTPPQPLDVLPSLTGEEIVVIGTSGCDGTLTCMELRGGIFAANESSTFNDLGGYDLGLTPELGFNRGAYYGLDQVALDDPISELNQVVAVVNSTDYWTGIFGLGIETTKFGTSESQPSFLTSLVDTEAIPSQSFGYTAGASYQLKSVPASLTLGGYDANRFEPNNATFSLDPGSRPLLAINSLSLNGYDNQVLLENSGQDLFIIDSTTSFMWLPESTVNSFEQALGLVYNDTLGVLLYPNMTVYQELISSNFSLNFDFADTPGMATKVTLSLSSDAITAHNLTYGFPNLHIDDTAPSVPYVPIRKAANATQYTLGRCFLQETYITVDYQRNNFSISQAKFSLDSTTNLQIVNINPPAGSGSGTGDATVTVLQSSDGDLSTGIKIGIGVGIVAIVSAIVTLVAVVWLYRRRKAYKKSEGSDSSTASVKPPRRGLKKLLLGARRDENAVPELAAREADPEARGGGFFGRRSQKKPAVEVDNANEIKELPAIAPVELPGSPVLGRDRSSSIAKTGLHDAASDEPVPTYESATSTSSAPSTGVSIPSPGLTFLNLSSTGPSPESTYQGQTFSSVSSSGNTTYSIGQPSPREDRPRYTLDDTQTFELRPSDLRPAGLVSPEDSEVGSSSHTHYSWQGTQQTQSSDANASNGKQ